MGLKVKALSLKLMGKLTITGLLKLQFNIDNIFDEEYYEGIGENSMNWGTPRNATLSVRYNF